MSASPTAPTQAAPWPAPTALGPVRGTVTLPGSKSMTNRALLLAALGEPGRPVPVRNALDARDSRLMAGGLSALGAVVRTDGPDWSVTPGAWRGPARIDVGNAGTVMRFLAAVAALADGPVHLDGDPRARERPVGPLLRALGELGVRIEDGGRGALPIVVHGTGVLPGGAVRVDASGSSQFVSALLLAAARADGPLTVAHEGPPMPSAPHVAMTVDLLGRAGIDVEVGPQRWTVHPGPVRAAEWAIEPDLSNAAPFLAAAAVTGGAVTVAGWPERTTQAGAAVPDLLAAMGATVHRDAAGLTVHGPDRLLGLRADLHDVGELAPVLAAACAVAATPSRLTGVAHLRHHETDRLAALRRELAALGADVTETVDGLDLRPARLHGGVFGTYDDHRLATAAAVIAAVVPGVRIENVATTAKTMPDFPARWADLLAGAGR